MSEHHFQSSVLIQASLILHTGLLSLLYVGFMKSLKIETQLRSNQYFYIKNGSNCCSLMIYTPNLWFLGASWLMLQFNFIETKGFWYLKAFKRHSVDIISASYKSACLLLIRSCGNICCHFDIILVG